MTTRPSLLPTIEAVAAAAGVSTATVSRALNRPDSVREALGRFESATWDQEKIKHHVSQFTEDAFSARLHEAVDKLAGY